MPVINSSSGKTAYGVRDFYLDKVEEFEQIKNRSCRPGSCAYIIETGDVYVLSNAGQWILQGQSGGNTNPPVIDKDAHYVWDGGDIVP